MEALKLMGVSKKIRIKPLKPLTVNALKNRMLTTVVPVGGPMTVPTVAISADRGGRLDQSPPAKVGRKRASAITVIIGNLTTCDVQAIAHQTNCTSGPKGLAEQVFACMPWADVYSSRRAGTGAYAALAPASVSTPGTNQVNLQ